MCPNPHTGDATGATAAFEYELHLDINGATDKITGTVTDIASGDVSEVDADRATFGASNKVPDRFLKAQIHIAPPPPKTLRDLCSTPRSVAFGDLAKNGCGKNIKNPRPSCRP